MDPRQLKKILKEITATFSIYYADFATERGIGGFVRFDEKKIFFDVNLVTKEEEKTWAHEILSIYYYWIKGIIKHDDEIEKESISICADKRCLAVLRQYQSSAKKKDKMGLTKSKFLWLSDQLDAH